MFTAALFIVGKRQKETQYQMRGEWIKKCSVHIMECYSASKMAILTQATTQSKCEDIMLSKIGQHQNNNFYMIPLMRSFNSKR